MAYEAIDCVDAGTEYCPCYLAETNDCIICSQLQGKAFCDCINWKGVCIYQEYVWNGEKRRDARTDEKVQILDKRMLNDNVIFLRLKVSKTLARELNQPGSYIFIRDNSYPQIFDVPMSIMYSDEVTGTIDLLIQLKGIKTKILKGLEDQVTIRGPYWNGIMGLKNLKRVEKANCLMIVRGIAQAPSVLVAKKLRFSKNNVTIILDKGTAQTDISKNYFNELGCSVIEMTMLTNRVFCENARKAIEEIMIENDVKFVYSGGTDIIHRNVIEIMKRHEKDILFTCTNNASMCCGEGICGSCSKRLKDGKRIKACKAQVDPVDIIGGI